jgi:hypothetical protein
MTIMQITSGTEQRCEIKIGQCKFIAISDFEILSSR